jgi:hypothetical protein
VTEIHKDGCPASETARRQGGPRCEILGLFENVKWAIHLRQERRFHQKRSLGVATYQGCTEAGSCPCTASSGSCECSSLQSSVLCPRSHVISSTNPCNNRDSHSLAQRQSRAWHSTFQVPTAQIRDHSYIRVSSRLL